MRPSSIAGIAFLGLLLAVRIAVGQQLVERDAELEDLPISTIRFEGADPDDEAFMRNNLRAAVGDPYQAETVRADVNRLYQLGRFADITGYATLLDDGTVEVLYQVVLQPLITGVQTIGNKALSDQELRGLIQQVPGGPRDEYLIERAKRDIKARYRKKGFYLTDVSVDESELETRGLLLFEIIEGPRVRVKAIEFQGAEQINHGQLKAEIKTRKHVPIFNAGILDEEIIEADKGALDTFYKDRGYLDVRVGHSIALSPDSREAKVVFHIVEGEPYTLRSVRVGNLNDPEAPLRIYTADQVAAMLEIKSGDVYSRDKLNKSVEKVQKAYGELGFLNARVIPYELRSGPEPVVDLMLDIAEGEYAKVGIVRINGNFLTKDKVIRRLVRLKPGRPYDAAELEASQQRIQRTRLFNDARITVQEPDPENPLYRDLLVEVKERNTGSVNFGVAIGSDSGVFGELSVVQNNFDVADFPRSLDELITGRAFRGAGQRFSMVFRPGTELFEYSISLTEPHLFETDYALTTTAAFLRRDYQDYDEQRLTGRAGLRRKLGDYWDVGATARAEQVKLSNIDQDAPVEIFEDEGPDTLTSIRFDVTRTTIREIQRPGRGSNFELSLDVVGALGGEFNFLNAAMDYTLYVTLDEDFLGRKTTVRLTSRAGYIFGEDEAPTYEKYYMGGRSFRGFEFRTVSPKGIDRNGQPTDVPVGGNWLVFFGAQYERPLIEKFVTGVVFVDSGTVTNEVSFDDYRVSVGLGIRLYIAALGPVPVAFDFGFPIVKLDSDDRQVLSFSAELPF